MNRLFKQAMDPISSETHFIGACFSCLGLLIMIFVGKYRETTPTIMLATIIFGVSLILLYSASAIYHYF